MNKEYDGPERRSNQVWDRRIPNMPISFGLFLKFIYASKRRFTTLFILACIGWIALISDIAISIYRFIHTFRWRF